jgi:hypothetical protein
MIGFIEGLVGDWRRVDEHVKTCPPTSRAWRSETRM